ncbi:cytochrome cbb3 oxidase maturation protein CcoI [Pyrolobus fumarii 1A]|uniref:Cytochrome cbb3 oxidase maturation protein CcoI n=1 Tax=Pyrolobus fumarii (strain DSM 11204 / 1A) TaxID=694429 RepID=G0EFJ3_PYRF1|nr:hypothetical protein [Pyrolobus fumarii]AEM39017.1 cytochrome cbb3 oxidase maturation protein CcoI [Pyrolobus fumarii 1A]
MTWLYNLLQNPIALILAWLTPLAATIAVNLCTILIVTRRDKLRR